MQDFVLSIIFVFCQLLLLGFLFGLVLLRKPDAGKPVRIPISAKTFLLGLAAGIVIMTAAIDISSFWFRSPEENRAGFALPQGADAGQPRLHPPDLRVTAEAWKGRPVIVRFDEDACLKFDFGTISCETDYVALYDAGGNRWTATGYSNAEKKVITVTVSNGEKRRGGLSIWGALSQFDDGGTVRRFGQVVGTIRVQSPAQDQNVSK